MCSEHQLDSSKAARAPCAAAEVIVGTALKLPPILALGIHAWCGMRAAAPSTCEPEVPVIRRYSSCFNQECIFGYNAAANHMTCKQQLCSAIVASVDDCHLRGTGRHCSRCAFGMQQITARTDLVESRGCSLEADSANVLIITAVGKSCNNSAASCTMLQATLSDKDVDCLLIYHVR